MSCGIVINNSAGYCVPGGSIEGIVVCIFDDQKQIRGTTLRLKGKEHTEWTEGSGKHKTYYKGNNNFLLSELKLQDEGTIAPGRYEFPFKFALPAVCPSTFMEEKNAIMYSLKANVDIPYAPDYTSKVTFTVISPLDLNSQPFINMSPARFQSEDTLLCWCCASGPITMNLELYKQAYIVGEPIKLKLHVSNLSNKDVEAISTSLIRVIQLKSTSSLIQQKTTIENILSSAVYTGVGAHGERDYDLELTAPEQSVLPNFNQCTLFEMWCCLKVTAELPMFYSDLDVGCAITLGHIPLRGTQGFPLAGPGYAPVQTTQPGMSGGVPYPVDNRNPPYPSATAPFYEEQSLLKGGLSN